MWCHMLGIETHSDPWCNYKSNVMIECDLNQIHRSMYASSQKSVANDLTKYVHFIANSVLKPSDECNRHAFFCMHLSAKKCALQWNGCRNRPVIAPLMMLLAVEVSQWFTNLSVLLWVSACFQVVFQIVQYSWENRSRGTAIQYQLRKTTSAAFWFLIPKVNVSLAIQTDQNGNLM